ncbi:hypothetical protein ACO0OE_003052 [Hanseniaspora uvarum]|nr:tryptophan--tRNA ligase [Hanseniaspora uvarum]
MVIFINNANVLKRRVNTNLKRFKSTLHLGYKIDSSILKKNQTVFSLIQPTGTMHLGNYLGAVSSWAELSKLKTDDSQKLIFGLADLHAITNKHPKAQDFIDNKMDTLAHLIAFGVDPEKCCLYIQSDVKEHAELAWYLSTITNIGALARMTQWKSKSGQDETIANNELSTLQSEFSLGLFSYPVLQAADVLLYNPDFVPVGEDQTQHLELTQTLARKFNHIYKSNVFKYPRIMTTPAKKIYSLKDVTKKMSKSDKSKVASIYLSDSDEEIRLKIKKATTDSIVGEPFKFDPSKRPGVSNLINIVAGIQKKEISEVEKDMESLNSHSELKKYVSDVIVEWIAEPREKYKAIRQDTEYLKKVALKGETEARKIASENMKKIREAMGFK